MQTAVQIAGLCVIGAVLAQLVRRQKPELALCLAMAACAAALGLAAGALEPVVAFFRRLQSLAGVEEALFAPLLKTLAIGVLTQIASAFCRDAGNRRSRASRSSAVRRWRFTRRCRWRRRSCRRWSS